jgi:hypothetical protein
LRGVDEACFVTAAHVESGGPASSRGRPPVPPPPEVVDAPDGSENVELGTSEAGEHEGPNAIAATGTARSVAEARYCARQEESMRLPSTIAEPHFFRLKVRRDLRFNLNDADDPCLLLLRVCFGARRVRGK